MFITHTFPEAGGTLCYTGPNWGETPGSVRRQKERGENSESFYDYSSGNNFCWAGSETDVRVCSLRVGNIFIHSYI